MQQRLANLSINAAQQLDWQREHIYDSLNNLAALFRGLPDERVLVLALTRVSSDRRRGRRENRASAGSHRSSAS